MSKPGKIVCIGRNYVEHIEELGNAMPEQMVVFNKPASAISQTLYASHQGEPLHYECELCFRYSEEGLTEVAVALDLTKRDLQSKLKEKGLPWERAKAFNGSVICSEFVNITNLGCNNLSLRLYIDDVLIQQGDVSQMLYPPHTIVEELQIFMPLEAGDWLMTGTPKGVGALKQGSKLVGQIWCGESCLVEQIWVTEKE